MCIKRRDAVKVLADTFRTLRRPNQSSRRSSAEETPPTEEESG